MTKRRTRYTPTQHPIFVADFQQLFPDIAAVMLNVTSLQVVFVTVSRSTGEGYRRGGRLVAPRAGTAVSKVDELMSGTLEKLRPDGLRAWQRRWFSLSRSRLRYYRSNVDTRRHAQLGELSLAEVVGVHSESPTEFVLVVANSLRPPYTLRASSATEAAEWVATIRDNAPRLHTGPMAPVSPTLPAVGQALELEPEAEAEAEAEPEAESDEAIATAASAAARVTANLELEAIMLQASPTADLSAGSGARLQAMATAHAELSHNFRQNRKQKKLDAVTAAQRAASPSATPGTTELPRVSSGTDSAPQSEARLQAMATAHAEKTHNSRQNRARRLQKKLDAQRAASPSATSNATQPPRDSEDALEGRWRDTGP